MNIAYLTQITNLDITNRNPLEYIKDYDKPEFEAIMPTHLLPKEILDWARVDSMPDNALDQFIESRVKLIIDDLKNINVNELMKQILTLDVNELLTF